MSAYKVIYFLISQPKQHCRNAQKHFIIKSYYTLTLYKPVGKYQFAMACIRALVMSAYKVIYFLISQPKQRCRNAQKHFIIKSYYTLILYKPVGKYQFAMACIRALVMSAYKVIYFLISQPKQRCRNAQKHFIIKSYYTLTCILYKPVGKYQFAMACIRALVMSAYKVIYFLISQPKQRCQNAQNHFIIKSYYTLILYKPVGKYQFAMACIRALVMSAYKVIYFLISQPKHMFWLLKRTVSMRRFF